MPQMKFTKMHGLGNDYIYVTCFDEVVHEPAALARAVSDRHTGVGGDGLILIQPSSSADVRMEMYNADGSRAELCGNGIRCVAKYAIEHGLVKSGLHVASSVGDARKGRDPSSGAVRIGSTISIETDVGLKVAECQMVDGLVLSVRVDMGCPSLSAAVPPCGTDLASRLAGPIGQASNQIINHPLRIGGCDYIVTCVSIGNPHAVVFVDDLDSVALDIVGPRFERAPEFPERINAHFVRVDSPDHVTVKTWERGSGITRACGTGACAVCVAGAITDRTRRRITVALPGGDLEIEWADDDHVYMTGPAVEVFTGDWPA